MNNLRLNSKRQKWLSGQIKKATQALTQTTEQTFDEIYIETMQQLRWKFKTGKQIQIHFRQPTNQTQITKPTQLKLAI